MGFFILTKKLNFDFILAKFWLHFALNRFSLIELRILIKKSFIILNSRKFEAGNLLHFSLTALKKKYQSVSLVIKVINRCRTKPTNLHSFSCQLHFF